MQYRENPNHYKCNLQLPVYSNPIPFCRAFVVPQAEGCGSFDVATTLLYQQDHILKEQTYCTPLWEAYAVITKHTATYLFTFLGLLSLTPLASSGSCVALGGRMGFFGGSIYFDSKSINVDRRLYLLFVPSFAHFKEQ